METADLAQMSPQDGVAALRSLPRRFRAALRPVDDPDVEEWAERVASSGHAPLDHLVDAERSIGLLAGALGQVLHHDTPVLVPATTDPAVREWPPHRGSLDDELARLGETAEALASLAERVPAGDWGRTATVAGGGGSVSALDVLREAVRTAVTDLRAAERDFDEVRRAAQG
ncbi:MAG: hypothetical protein KDB10_15080 [Acidimicrobiales bacterium]|nr:hypothetical protein [Acidimicrobiales bacterium]MCB9371266.1 hypothetical protein [Microthrixaceae bacterium]